MFKTIVIGIIVTVVGLFALSTVNKAVTNQNTNNLNGYNTSEKSDDNTSSIAISGEVVHAGSYYISTTSTLGELITLAGGVTTDADETTYNTSLVINTRTSFYIAPVLTSSSLCADESSKVNINTATQDELTSVGFTSSQAPTIITYRGENGYFEALEDILNVKGVGKATFEKVKNKICLS